MRNRPILQMVLFGLLVAAVGIALALTIPWFPSTSSTQAHRIHTLYDVLLIVSVPIFALVLTVVVFSIARFRMRPGEELKDGPPIHGNTRLEVVWTALPAVLIIGLCTYAYTVLRSNEAAKADAMTVNVTERQFAFQFSYPQPGGKTVVSPALYLPRGRPVVFKLRSYDVVHSFFVPDFSEKLDAVPGIVTTLRVTPTKLGNFPAECTELCGAGHGLMRAPVHVVTPQAFQTWLAAQQPGAAPPIGIAPANVAQIYGAGATAGSAGGQSSASASSSGSSAGSSAATSAAAGKAIFTGSAGCGACHTLAAAGTSGQTGPNLDVRLRTDCATAASKKVRGATLQQCVTTAITRPYAYLPAGYSAGIMPSTFAQTLTPSQIQALVNFLSSAAK